MTPALGAAEMQPDHSLQTLARAFEALLLTTQQLSCKEKTLQLRLKYANNEVNTYHLPLSLRVHPLHFPNVSHDEKI